MRDIARAIRKRAALAHARAVSLGAIAAVVALLAAGVFSVSTDGEPGMLFYALLALGAAPGPGRDVAGD